MQKLFRDDYRGERVIVNSDRVGGVKVDETQWINNTLNMSNSGYAIVMGNSFARDASWFNGYHLFTHHGGPTPLTFYACNAAFRDLTPHILVVKNRLIADEIVNSGYADNNIVFTTASNILRHDNKFHLIPFDPQLNAGATAMYMAAFDGHKHVYFWAFDLCAGADGSTTYYGGTLGYPPRKSKVNFARFGEEIFQVMETYDDVEFIRVGRSKIQPFPTKWSTLPNFRQIDFNQFKREVNLGTMRT